MENVWEATSRLTHGSMGEGWEDWLGSILGPIAVLILLTNVSSVRLLLSLRRQGKTRGAVPTLSSLFMGPVILYGIAHVVRIYAEQHPEFRAFALAIETVTAAAWLVAVARLSTVLTRVLEPPPKPVRAPAREFVAASSSGSFPHPPSPTPTNVL
jgi:hypothetical protein